MLYSTCCGTPSHMAPDVDLCPTCLEHTDWEDWDGEEVDNQSVESVRNSQNANDAPNRCVDCPHMSGSVELAVDYCIHPSFGFIAMEIENPDAVLDNCPLKQPS